MKGGSNHVTDLVDYLRDKLEHAGDPTPFRAYGFDGRLLWQYEEPERGARHKALVEDR